MVAKPRRRDFPLQPLLDTLNHLNNLDIADLLTIHRKNWWRARQRGYLTADQADEWAIKAGYHPAEIWGDQWNTYQETCPQGHPMTDDNTHHAPGRAPQCRTCIRARRARWRAKQRTEHNQEAS